MARDESREKLNTPSALPANERRRSTNAERAARERMAKEAAGTLWQRLWMRLRRNAEFICRRVRMVADEWHANNFPESNRVLVQLVLFAVNMVPMLTSLARERLRRLRLFHLRRTGGAKHGAAWRRRKGHPAIFVGAALTLAACLVVVTNYTIATSVLYEGEVLEIVESERAARRIASKVEEIATETTGERFAFSDSSIQYTSGIVARSEIGSTAQLEQELTDETGLVTYGYSLYIDDEPVGSTIYEGALESLLEQLKASYVSEDTLTIDFAENVRIAEGYVPTDSVVNLGQIAELINSTKSGEVTYTVVRGDTWGKIANENGMSSQELLALNPGFDIDKLSIGEVLTISNAVPYLTVVVTERQNYVEDVQYDISYVDDASMYQGDYRVISKGEYGSADVVAEVTYVNGMEQERTVISFVMLTDPVTERRAQGTKPRPSWFPTGQFRWPTTGRISSYFGYRNTGIRGASTNHKGIDITCSYGTPIYAADGGTVCYSGWWGSGGYTIIIDHGNGYKTYYEHNSSLLVSVGTHVYKGQKIAKAGRSGVASGVHCHFGIEKYGTYVNPLKYLP